MTLTRPAANRDTISFILFLIAAIIFAVGAFGGHSFSTKPEEWTDAGLFFFVLAALV